MDYLATFKTAFSKPILKPIDWPAEVGPDHPIREAQISVRYWPPAIDSKIKAMIAAEEAKEGGRWVKAIYWYVLAVTVMGGDEPLFSQNWAEVWPLVQVTLPPDDPRLQPDATTGFIPLPAVDYDLLAGRVEKDFDSLQGQLIAEILFNQAMAYNGFVATEAKNSEKTNTSV